MRNFIEYNYGWLVLGVVLIALSWAYYMESKVTPQEKQLREERTRCISKSQGSRPACWTQRDWQEFCKHVQCKSSHTLQ